MLLLVDVVVTGVGGLGAVTGLFVGNFDGSGVGYFEGGRDDGLRVGEFTGLRVGRLVGGGGVGGGIKGDGLGPNPLPLLACSSLNQSKYISSVHGVSAMQIISYGHTPCASPLGHGMAAKQLSVTSAQSCPQNRLLGSSPSTGRL